MNRNLSVLILVLVAGLGAGATFFLQYATAPHISAEQRLIESRNLLDMLLPGSYDNQPLDQPLALKDVALSSSTLLGGYLATVGGKPSAVILRSQTIGYEGTIELLIVIDVNGKLLGVKTLKQSETPGLGGKIADQPNPWLQSFIGKSRVDPADSGWALKKDQGQFDQIAGATVTSRAVVSAIHDALRYFDEHQPQLTGSGQ
ncbi:RnfABCDGE type electron transport complex subunit G [Pseudomonas sp. 6D_7.1_Bac1]|uniref:RnfABCDGE type electron transport complex subunit G n=1 Tax=Pseudomonas sp. 6D_7.1_Bac1 TaxID=2971615 RepID=UPI0021C6B45A|nr:RnfABCDGE type electron transport complex subunit G [Pseudomonas sp. 6D_7.1_Bac1]MCU1749625.1 RnfABCDGE type electron transport complex subunit G [Pseudomonas sp. 6D_7.1_Bac1]